MDEVITCTLLGIASTAVGDLKSNPTGRETWIGVRVRTADGKARFFPRMLVEAEAAIILGTALERGEQVELWFTGKDKCAYPYGIRTTTEEWYHDGFQGELTKDAIKFLVAGILLLPIIGIGILAIIASVGLFLSAAAFSAHHSRETFDLGYEAGVLGRLADASPAERRQAA